MQVLAISQWRTYSATAATCLGAIGIKRRIRERCNDCRSEHFVANRPCKFRCGFILTFSTCAPIKLRGISNEGPSKRLFSPHPGRINSSQANHGDNAISYFSHCRAAIETCATRATELAVQTCLVDTVPHKPREARRKSHPVSRKMGDTAIYLLTTIAISLNE